MNLADLGQINEETIRLAGPRYSPGVDPAAPNIQIAELVDAFDALSVAPGLTSHINTFIEEIEEVVDSGRFTLSRLFRRQKISPAIVEADLRHLAALSPSDDLEAVLQVVRRHLRGLSRALDRAQTKLYEEMGLLGGDDSQREPRARLDGQLRDVRGLDNAINAALTYLDGAPGRLLGDVPRLLLLGAWGTGKTHFLCDMARKAVAEGTPAIVVLASSLTPGTDPLDAIAQLSRSSGDGTQLLQDLDALGRQSGRRALLMVDAINEGDREIWRGSLEGLVQQVRPYRNIGLVLSCRRPFDQAIFASDRQRRLFVRVDHVGFAEREFDAQLEYFKYYGVPAPHIPLLTPEFSRPLFLKLLCESLKSLSTSGQHRQLRDIASGQKGMTYVLESFAKAIGAPIEQDFGLSGKQCWRILKGDSRYPGVAGTMAARNREFLIRDEVLQCITVMTGLSPQEADRLARRMLADGLLAEDMRYQADAWVEVIVFPYQRFGDHVVARHLLDAHLQPGSATEQSIRRLFYAGRPLGRPFELEDWRPSFKAPGLAAALMLEFPERMKRTALPKEVIYYLPKSRQYVAPIKEVLLDGLYWRASSSFTEETSHLISFLLRLDDDSTRDETFEVLVTLATRSKHPYNAATLYHYLAGLSMPSRDVTWTEFLRRSDDHSIVNRLIVWIERTASSRRGSSEVANEFQLLSLMLTSTVRILRDKATRAITLLGLGHPEELFSECLLSLEYNDPYVGERMLASAYGVAMRLWAARDGEAMRASIVPFARKLTKLMFLSGAPHATTHTLTRDYALGVIQLARRVDVNAIATRHVRYLSAPHRASGPGFPIANKIRNSVADSVKSVLHMDFENYTIGRLIPDRGNYQMEHPEYKEVRKQILWRVRDLGYTTAMFDKIDTAIGRYAWNRQDGDRIDRYGKKYAWIAYFEMYGLREDQGKLDAHRTIERTSDCDVDPSFPEAPRTWTPPMASVFSVDAPTGVEWLRSGIVPDYRSLLRQDVIEGIRGPWILLDGFVLERSDELEAFTFLRSVLLGRSAIAQLQRRVQSTRYLGNDKIPDGGSDHYSYAGEIPWSPRFGLQEDENGRPIRRRFDKAFRWHQGRWDGIPVEVPVWTWSWESYHSKLNQIGNMEVPSPALCERLALHGEHASLDLRDSTGRQASLYRQWPEGGSKISKSYVVYFRQDLLVRYLKETKQRLVWVPWGERNVYRRGHDMDRSPDVMAALQEYAHTFGDVVEWEGNP